MWLAIAVVGYALLAIVALLDKMVVSKEKVDPLQFTFFSTIILTPALIVAPFFGLPQTNTEWFAVLVGGVAYSGALYTMYRSFAAGEVSHNGPLIGALTPVCTFIITTFVLPEPLTAKQLGAIGFLILGSLIISIKNTTAHRGLQSLWYSVAAGALFSVYFVAAKFTYQTLGFGKGFFWISAVMGVCGLFLFVRTKFKGPSPLKKVAKKKQPVAIMATDKVAAGAGVILIQYALSQGSPTIINALTGLQYAILVILVAVLSAFKPKLFKEKYEKGEVAQEVLAVLVIMCGLALLVI